MTKTRVAILLIGLVCLLLNMAACNPEKQPCLEPKLVTLNLGVYRAVLDTGNHVIITDSIFQKGEILALTNNVPQAFYYGPSSKYHFYMSPDTTSCTWLISPDSLATADTLTFYYRKKLTFLSNACGYTYYYDIDSVKKTASSRIDSLILSNTNVTNNVNTEHVKIYFH